MDHIRTYMDHTLETGRLAASGGFISSIYGWYKARNTWKKRLFLRRLNVALHYFETDPATGRQVLKFRTVFERNIEEVLLNNHAAVAVVLTAANRVTAEEPFLELPVQDRWFILSSIMHAVSENVVIGHFARDLGMPTRSDSYIFGIAFEADTSVRFHKIRVILIKESTLKQILSGAIAEPVFEKHHHAPRWHTLRKMSALYSKEREDIDAEEELHHLMRIEITIPLFCDPSNSSTITEHT